MAKCKLQVLAFLDEKITFYCCWVDEREEILKVNDMFKKRINCKCLFKMSAMDKSSFV